MERIQTMDSLTQRVFETLRTAIVSGELEPDTLHAVNSVANTLGVSRTPTREALIRLAEAGLVRFEPHRGFVVLRSTAEDLQEIFRIRLLTEVPSAHAAATLVDDEGKAALEADLEAMRLAAKAQDYHALLKADRGFHRTIMEISGNPRLAEFVDGLRDVVLTRGVSTAGITREFDEIIAIHVAIRDDILAGDPVVAARSMRDHVSSTAHMLLTQEFGPEAAEGWDASTARWPLPQL
jgi:DNA-binding GntR family transcriptional regulator